MAITVGSTSSASGTGTSISITAPTGIQTGNQLIIVAGGYDTDINTPSGFTQFLDLSISSGAFRIKYFYKHAVLADESTGSYSVTKTSGTTNLLAGAMFRISGGIGSGSPAISTATASGTVLKPANDNVLIMAGGVAGAQRTASGYTITHGGSNPTWTEIIDFNTATSTAASFFVAYANTTDTSNVTAYSVTLSGSGGTTGLALASLPQTQAASGTFTTHTASPAFFTVSGSAGVTGTFTTHTTSPTFSTVEGQAGAKVWTPITRS